MTELDLYKFINDNIEYNVVNKDEIYTFIPHYRLKEFTDLLGRHILDDEGINVVLLNAYISVEMTEVCEYFDIDPNNIFKNGK